MDKISPEWLQTIAALQDVPLEQLQWLIDNSTQHELEEGGVLYKPGDPIKGTFVVISGAIRSSILQGKELRELATYESKAVTGYLPFSRAKTVITLGEAMSQLEYLLFPVERMNEMIHTQF